MITNFISKIFNYFFGKDTEHIQKNFPFKYRGLTYWYSRSCAVVLFTYCKNKDGELCVLANKRGKGAPDFQGYWNACCGYLDWNENSITASRRETMEETNIRVPLDKIEVVGVDSDPSSNKQNVVIRHRAFLDGTTEDWHNFSTKHNEKDETSAIAWIPLKNLVDYDWAFGHEELIRKYAE